jgi:hypothetical protein
MGANALESASERPKQLLTATPTAHAPALRPSATPTVVSSTLMTLHVGQTADLYAPDFCL